MDGRITLVTGVSRQMGIEFAIARRLAEQGANLFLHSWAPFDAARLIAWPWGNDARWITGQMINSTGGGP